MTESFDDFSLDDSTPVGDYRPSEEELRIAGELNKLTGMMEEFQKAIAEFDAMRSGGLEEIKTMKQRIQELDNLDRELAAKQFDIKRDLRKIEREKESAERSLQQAQHNRLLALEFEQQQEAFEKLTMNAPWREWAMDHQVKGGKILANAKRAILGDKRGLGKTLTSQIYCDMLQAKKIIYLSPGDVIRTVEREIQHWAPHRTVAPLGMMTKAQRRVMLDALKRLDSFVITINYEAWRKDLSLLEDIASLQVDTIILDEAHNIKDKKSIAFRGVEKMVYATNQCPQCGGAVEIKKSRIYSWTDVPTCRACDYQSEHGGENFEWCSIKNVLPMTGTPILNKPQDLFTLLTLIDRENFHNEFTFLRDYCTQDIYTGKWKFRTGGMDALIKKMSSKFLVRDRHSAGVVLPKQHETVYELELNPVEYPEQWRLSKMLNEYSQIMLSEDKAINILAVIALITRKRQMMTWPAGIKWPILDENEEPIPGQFYQVECDESIKIDRIIQYVNSDVNEYQGLIPELTSDGNMEDGERVVVFSQFKEPLKELERRCEAAGISVVRYDGDTPRSVRDQVVVDFDRKYCNQPGYEKKWQVVLAHYKTGGVGLNLTDATQMIILDEEWNPGKVDQAYGRIDRMGQTEETTVHVLRVKNSVDTWMHGLVTEKAEMIEGFESAHSMAQSMLDAIRNGDMI